MDESNRRPQLPALSVLPPKNEEGLVNRLSGSASQMHSSSSAPSPMHSYSGPPPPYGAVRAAPPAGHSWSGSQPSPHTRLEPRRTSVDDRDGAKSVVRQSLPSLSEIMATEAPPMISKAAPLPPPPSSNILPPHASQPRSIEHAPRSPPPPQRIYAQAATASYPPYASARPEESSRPPFVSHDSGNTIYATSEDSRVSANMSSTHQSPRDSIYRGPREHSPVDQPMHSAAPMGPPNAPYGYASYPARQDYPVQQPPAGPLYQPSSLYGPPAAAAPGWRPESASYPPHHRQDEYKETVKRHLDTQHLEFALNEIARSSGILADFARRYTDQLYQSQRSLLTASKLPSIVEIDDMAAKSKVQLDQLMSIRDFIIGQQSTPFDHPSGGPLPVDSRHPSASEGKPLAMTGGDHSPHDSDDKMSSYGGPDLKKPRRGRAAPPGRCHSCNRAETPEWRRGPDGARTLCNACGLHYAKLTRKNQISGGAKSAASMSNSGGSNLRPKDGLGH